VAVIETEEQLAALLPRIEAAPWIALDTEADSLHAYPEKLCLVQISVPGADELIDPLAGCDLKPLLAVLQQKELLLHGADYDLRLLYRTYQFVPKAVFDTMWAARLLGYLEFSLSALVDQHLGLTLEKGPQKMNWAVRPLPERMATYARNDTRHLHALAELLRSRLLDKGRLSWQAEVCANMIRECSLPRQEDPDTLWRVKGSDRLEPAALAVLRELWQWREAEAIASNKPPYFIFSHEKLVALSAAAARGHPTHNLVPRHVPSQRVARLALAVQRGLQAPPPQHPQPRHSTGVRLRREQQRQFDYFKRIRDAQAQNLGLDSTVIATKGELIMLAQDGQQSKCTLMGWQRALLALG
jgi:ribonuclease D